MPVNNQNNNPNQNTNYNNNSNKEKDDKGNMLWIAATCAAITGACILLFTCCLKNEEKKSTLGLSG